MKPSLAKFKAYGDTTKSISKALKGNKDITLLEAMQKGLIKGEPRQASKAVAATPKKQKVLRKPFTDYEESHRILMEHDPHYRQDYIDTQHANMVNWDPHYRRAWE